jgi:hypothetical protein
MLYHQVHDPYAVFRSSTTPFGLYARQKWLGESSTPQWKEDFATTVGELARGQSSDGLWRGSAMETIQRLFGLHLTVRHSNPCIDSGLDTLLKIASESESGVHPGVVSSARLRGLPFAEGPRQSIILPATLFLCAIFGRSAAPVVLVLYDRVISGMVRGMREEQSSSLHNILRALVVHPQYAGHPATLNLVAWLGDRQTQHGDWGPDIPFYQAVNALAHLDTPAANQQIECAVERLVSTQKTDGSWGDTQREWSTFLAVHALSNKGIL